MEHPCTGAISVQAVRMLVCCNPTKPSTPELRTLRRGMGSPLACLVVGRGAWGAVGEGDEWPIERHYLEALGP